jgi:hypothetical protein
MMQRMVRLGESMGVWCAAALALLLKDPPARPVQGGEGGRSTARSAAEQRDGSEAGCIAHASHD